jgi:hypothetical protein
MDASPQISPASAAALNIGKSVAKTTILRPAVMVWQYIILCYHGQAVFKWVIAAAFLCVSASADDGTAACRAEFSVESLFKERFRTNSPCLPLLALKDYYECRALAAKDPADCDPLAAREMPVENDLGTTMKQWCRFDYDRQLLASALIKGAAPDCAAFSRDNPGYREAAQWETFCPIIAEHRDDPKTACELGARALKKPENQESCRWLLRALTGREKDCAARKGSSVMDEGEREMCRREAALRAGKCGPDGVCRAAAGGSRSACKIYLERLESARCSPDCRGSDE